MKSKSLLGICLFIIFLSSYPLCFADGVFIPTVVIKYPDIPVQRSLIKYVDGMETLIIEAALDGKGKSFGWIIPIPSVPERLERISPGLLKTLSLQLEPEIIYRRPKIGNPFFFSGLGHKDWKVRKEAARRLDQITDPIILEPALEPLLLALGDEK